MKYQYFAFLDVLGYRELLAHDIASGSLGFKDKLISSFRALDDINGAEFKYRSISDSILIYCDSEKSFVEFLMVVKRLYIAFLSNGLFVRGGISYDLHFENNSILYSVALAKAYQLESKVAIYPRIVIDENVIGAIENKGQGPSVSEEKLIVRDGDLYQLHVLDENNWNDCYNFAMSIYSSGSKSIDSNPSVRLKHLWFQSYLFNFSLNGATQQRYIPEWNAY